MSIWTWVMVGLVPAGASNAVQTAPVDTGFVAAASATPVAATPIAMSAILVAGAPVTVMTNEEISTMSCTLGHRFGVTVVREVVDQGTVVIPAGVLGSGEITFCTNRGGFGKPGILGIALRTLDLNGKSVLLDGRYREEGRNKDGATAATWFAVGVFSGFIKGKPGIIPKGRELRARTGEDILFVPGATPPVTPGAQAVQPIAHVADAAPQTIAAIGEGQPAAGEENLQAVSR